MDVETSVLKRPVRLGVSFHPLNKSPAIPRKKGFKSCQLKMEPENGGVFPLEKEIPNLETTIFRFYVKFRGCDIPSLSTHEFFCSALRILKHKMVEPNRATSIHLHVVPMLSEGLSSYEIWSNCRTNMITRCFFRNLHQHHDI